MSELKTATQKEVQFRVVVNGEGQYSIWPSDRETPLGWSDTGVSGGREVCLEKIAGLWTDMRPVSVRNE